jgi:predicted kinase
VLDAAFLRSEERAAFTATAPADHHISLFLEADRAIRLSRIDTRKNDASDATAAVAIAQEAVTEGDLDWLRIEAGGTPAETLARCAPVLAKLFPN